MCPRDRFALYKSSSRLVLYYKKDWATLLHFIYFHCLLLVTIDLITKLFVTYNSVLAEKTLLKTAYHFLLLLVGFDTLTYRMDYDRSHILVGHRHPIVTTGIHMQDIYQVLSSIKVFNPIKRNLNGKNQFITTR